MSDASSLLVALSSKVAAPYTLLDETIAAMVTGSVAKGLADFHSDVDMTIYYESLPAEDVLAGIRTNLGALERKWLIGDRVEGSFAEAFDLHGVEVQIGHTTVEAWEASIDEVLIGLDCDTPTQKALEGTLNCIPLFGHDHLLGWQEKISAYPDALARKMVESHMAFFPVWSLTHHFETRDAPLWYFQSLTQATFNLVAILAGLNRLYFTDFQFKRVAYLVDQMQFKPDDLVHRLNQVLRAPAYEGAYVLEQLVADTLDLVDQKFPDIDTAFARRRLGWRQEPWHPDDFETNTTGRN